MSEKRPGIDLVMEWLSKRNAPVVVDIGAHVGKFTEMCRDVNPEATVYAVEPVYESIRKMRPDSRVVVVCAAIGTSNGTTTIHFPIKSGKDRSQGATLNRAVLRRKKKAGAIDHIRPIEVWCVTFDELIRGTPVVPDIDLLKLNCEGSEYEILSKPFPVPVRSVFVSWHDDQAEGRKGQCVEILRQSGLHCVSSAVKGDHTWEFWREE